MADKKKIKGSTDYVEIKPHKVICVSLESVNSVINLDIIKNAISLLKDIIDNHLKEMKIANIDMQIFSDVCPNFMFYILVDYNESTDIVNSIVERINNMGSHKMFRLNAEYLANGIPWCYEDNYIVCKVVLEEYQATKTLSNPSSIIKKIKVNKVYSTESIKKKINNTNALIEELMLGKSPRPSIDHYSDDNKRAFINVCNELGIKIDM